jgi:hypothetical protein
MEPCTDFMNARFGLVFEGKFLDDREIKVLVIAVAKRA